ncbi:hypothetical protein P9228_06110 [Mesorhizobium sp. WSM4898]|uniref:hypothetical protein n=1 Tax=Mesorhizobium sp. WSM4898 TaxID=3038544 RepID=UPI0024150FFC|nr:hypothetical protein [Mesorhizobium sp. WSM4898]MDG4906022.1 hypothetical protein [Mesorhizobium sp. WSM4898]
MKFHHFDQAAAAWAQHRSMFEQAGIYLPDARAYIVEAFRTNHLAMDAQPQLATAPNAGIPAFLTTLVDPEVYRILFAPTKAAEIFGEIRKGTWIDQTAMFPVVEQTGEVSSYGDYNDNGRAGANMNWPQRQSYLFQTISEYGELEIERAGLGRVNWVGEVDGAGVTVLARFLNTTYFKGVQGLQNYGLLNDPNLAAPITPAPKAYGGVKWINNGQIVATANEIYSDLQSLWLQLVTQTAGLVDQNTKMTLAMSPESQLAMTATNSFNVNVEDLLKKNFPNLRVVSAVQYRAETAINPTGISAGNVVQFIADGIDGQPTGYCAFNEKLRAHPIVRALSSWKKKMSSGTWGAIIRQPMGISQMVGV